MRTTTLRKQYVKKIKKNFSLPENPNTKCLTSCHLLKYQGSYNMLLRYHFYFRKCIFPSKENSKSVHMSRFGKNIKGIGFNFSKKRKTQTFIWVKYFVKIYLFSFHLPTDGNKQGPSSSTRGISFSSKYTLFIYPQNTIENS